MPNDTDVVIAVKSALGRRSIRERLNNVPGLDASVVSTAGAVLARGDLRAVQHIVVDTALLDAERVVRQLIGDNHGERLHLVATEPTTARSKFDLSAHQVVAMPLDVSTLGRVLLERLNLPVDGGRPHQDSAGIEHRRELVVIGASTGGPEALATVLAGLPAEFPAPILVVQHLSKEFIKPLAERLDRVCPLTVREVVEPVRTRAGEVWLAPGDRHLVVKNTLGSVDLDDGPVDNKRMPSVDVLFRSAAEHYGEGAVAIVLTGGGEDGRRGASRLAAVGAHVIAQDQDTSVVWGMAGAVTKAGLANEVVPISTVADALRNQFLIGARAPL